MQGIGMEVAGDDHDIVISPDARLQGSRLRVKDSGCTVRIGAGVTGKWDMTVSRGGKLIIGDDTTCETSVVVAQSQTLEIGRDCMLSFSVEIRTTDTHALYDVETGERINADQPVTIGDHVWLAKQAVVLKGTTIGSGSVIGTRAVASGDIPPLSVSAGVPARILREGVTWTRKIGAGRLKSDAAAVSAIKEIRRQSRQSRG